ncbi:MAG: hypothetical protein JWQ90_3029 [Hydrocarboniphaga sp.]|nr:hypothetical protein [Hydrocarboniphaga sp.]MDB5970579.1 hypothetical protein [Hydrocarboniphaga sp.]
MDQRGHDICEMHFYAGLTVEGLCAVTELSPATVKRNLRKTRAQALAALGHKE